MKKLILYTFAFFALSCSLNDDTTNDYQELLPIETAQMPENVTVGVAEEIFLTYLRPTNCHAYNDIYYTKNESERTVAIVSTYFASNNNCTMLDSDNELEASFRFQAAEPGMYTFKFWQGKNDEDEDEYLIYELEAIN